MNAGRFKTDLHQDGSDTRMQEVRPEQTLSPPSTFVEVLRTQAARHPAKLAFRFLQNGATQSDTVSYSELDLRAKALAAALQQRCDRGQRAVLLLPSGIEYVAAFLGCLYAGVIPVPCYPPSEERGSQRLVSIIADCDPALTLTTASSLSGMILADARGKELISLDVATISKEAASSWKEVDIGPSTTALLQYTSGSTSNPKGVEVTHAHLIANEIMIREAFAQNESSVVVTWLPLYHDMGLIGGVLQPLFAGASSVLMPPAAFLHRPLRWLEAIARYRATTSGGPDFAYRLCIEKARGAHLLDLELSSWQVAFNGAERVRANTVRLFAETFSPYGFRQEAFYPCYGLAEATLFVTGQKSSNLPRLRNGESATGETAVGADNPDLRAEVSCGLPPHGSEIAIVDQETMRRKGPGEMGEIWVSSPSVALGYYNQPELTKSIFRAEIEGAPGHLYLRTGDLGCISGGELYVTGRVKDLIIVRGENHYPEDIECTAAAASGELADCACVAFANGENEQIVLIQETPKGRTLMFDQWAGRIREAVAREHGLTLHEIAFVKRGSIPRTSSGKFQRSASRELYNNGKLRIQRLHKLAESDGAPAAEIEAGRVLSATDRTDRILAIEELLIVQIAATLGIEPGAIDRNTSTASLGLDSLAAAAIKSNLETQLRVVVPVSEIISASSICALAERIEHHRAEDRLRLPELRNGLCPAATNPNEATLPPDHKRLWFLEQLHPGSAAYNLSAVIRISGPVDQKKLAAVVHATISRQKALQTRFVWATEGPVQRLADSMPTPVPIETHLGLSEAEKTLAIRRSLNEEQRTGFNLATGPVARFRLLAFSEDEYALIATAHHIVADAWSFHILLREIAASYGSTEDVANPELSFAEFTTIQNRRFEGSSGDLDYWTQEFRDPPSLTVIPHFRSSARETSEPRRETFSLDKDLTSALRDRCRHSGHTLFTYLFSAFVAVLSRWTGDNDLTVGVSLWGRDVAGAASLFGLFSYPALLRLRFDGAARADDLLAAARKKVQAALEHPGVSFDQLLDLARPMRKGNEPFRLPLLFSMLPPAERVRQQGIEFQLDAIDGGGQDIGLFIAVQEAADCIRGDVRFDAQLLDPEIVRSVIGVYTAAIEAFVRTPELRIADLKAPVVMQPRHSLVIASTFTAEPLQEVLRFWSEELKTPLDITFAPYQQIFQQLLDPGSLFRSNQARTNCVLVRLSDWIGKNGPDTPGEAQQLRFDAAKAEDFVTAIHTSADHSSTPYLICFVPSGDGSGESQDPYHEWECKISGQLQALPGVTALTSDQIAAPNLASYYDPVSDKLGHIPFTPLYFAALGTAIIRSLYLLHAPRYKVIATDCDETLWHGVCGEDGPRAVYVDEGRRRLQQFLVQQHESGMLVCLCSKNNEKDVAEVFEQQPAMPFQRAHAVAEKINWRPKAENLRQLASELRLGLDTFIFMDDDGVECAAVRAGCPGVQTLQLPSDSASLADLLSHFWAFDARKTSAEDRNRTAAYKQEASREQHRSRSQSMLDFLRELDLRVAISNIAGEDLPRASQLSYRTSQFTTTSTRHSEAELEQWTRGERAGCLVIRASDRFGDYGLIGLLLHREEKASLIVESWSLSCRALGRGRRGARGRSFRQSRARPRFEGRRVPLPRNRP